MTAAASHLDSYSGPDRKAGLERLGVTQEFREGLVSESFEADHDDSLPFGRVWWRKWMKLGGDVSVRVAVIVLGSEAVGAGRWQLQLVLVP